VCMHDSVCVCVPVCVCVCVYAIIFLCVGGWVGGCVLAKSAHEHCPRQRRVCACSRACTECRRGPEEGQQLGTVGAWGGHEHARHGQPRCECGRCSPSRSRFKARHDNFLHKAAQRHRRPNGQTHTQTAPQYRHRHVLCMCLCVCDRDGEKEKDRWLSFGTRTVCVRTAVWACVRYTQRHSIVTVGHANKTFIGATHARASACVCLSSGFA
jgi:hypothetical protein